MRALFLSDRALPPETPSGLMVFCRPNGPKGSFEAMRLNRRRSRSSCSSEMPCQSCGTGPSVVVRSRKDAGGLFIGEILGGLLGLGLDCGVEMSAGAFGAELARFRLEIVGQRHQGNAGRGAELSYSARQRS